MDVLVRLANVDLYTDIVFPPESEFEKKLRRYVDAREELKNFLTPDFLQSGDASTTHIHMQPDENGKQPHEKDALTQGVCP